MTPRNDRSHKPVPDGISPHISDSACHFIYIVVERDLFYARNFLKSFLRLETLEMAFFMVLWPAYVLV